MQKFDINKLSIQSMEIFLSIFDNASVTSTAHAFELSQSTISHALEKMRVVFGDPLFVTEGRKMRPTDRATSIEPNLRKIVSEYSGIFEPKSLDELLTSKPIRIASNTTSLTGPLSQFSILAAQAFPNVALEFIDLGPSENVQKFLYEDSVDIVITVQSERYSPALKARPIFAERHRIFYDQDCREPIITVQQFCAAKHTAIGFGGSKRSVLGQLLEQQGLEREVFLTAPNAYCLAKLIKGTDRIATLNASLAKNAFEGFASTPLPFPAPKIEFDMIWHARDDASQRNQWIRDTLLKAAQRAA